MAEVRSVSVHLDADIASYVAKMRLAGTETDRAFGRADRGISVTNARLTTTDKTLGRVDTSVRRLGTDMDSTRGKVDNGARSLDRYSGRLGIFLDLILGLGPALVPISAVAVPTVFALGQNFLAAGAGAVTAKLAFMGVGNALTAVNKYALDPTAENLDAARLALSQLSPEARRFTIELSRMKPELDSLRDAAASGLLPGVGQGLESLRGDLPIIRQGLHGIGIELGGIAAEAGASLSSDRWQPFLRFVAREAPVGLGVMANATGDVVHGLAELVMAFNPLTHDIDRGILNLAEDFDRWASSVGRTRGFQDFLDYVRENGPRVMDLLGNTATALLDIGRAAAPIGGPIIDTLNVFLKVIDAIARSDIGTPILLGLTAMRLMTRATALWGKVSASSTGTFIANQRAAVTAIRSTTASQEASAAGWATLRGGALKAGAGLAGIGLIASGATDKMHLTNTATLALAGSMLGLPGVIGGAAVGALLDFTQRSDESAAATTDFSSTLNQNTGALTDNTTALAAQVLQQDGAFENAKALGLSLDTVTQAALGNKDAIAEVTAATDVFLGVTKAGYTAGGATVIDPQQARNARELLETLGVLTPRIKDAQQNTRELHDATHHAATAAEEAAHKHRLLANDLRAERTAASAATDKWEAFGDSLDDGHKSLNQFIQDLAKQARALAQFGENALTAARKGLDRGLIKSLRDAGPEGALRMRQLANASQSEIGKANRAWGSWTGAINTTQGALVRATSRTWRIRLEAAQALNDARAVASAIAAIHSKTVSLTTVRVTGGHSVAGNAEGGTIPGPRTPYGDRVLRWLAPGEEVISNSRGQADQFRPLLKQINGMADGGTVDTTPTRHFQPVLYAAEVKRMHAVNEELHTLEHRLKDSSAALDKEKQQRDSLVQARQSLVSSIRANFRSDLFGVGADDGGIWVSGAGSMTDPSHILRQDIRNAREYRQDIRRLRRRGATDAVLSQITDLDEAEQAMGLSRHELRQVGRLFRIRQRASQAAGATTGDAVFADNIREQTKIVRRQAERVHHLNEQIRETNKRLAEIKKAVEHDGPQNFAKAVNKTASTAARRRRAG